MIKIRKQKKKFAFTSLLGLLGGSACIAYAIFESSDVMLFVNIPSLFMIVGGTAFVLIVSFPFHALKQLGPVLCQVFINDKHSPIDDIDAIVELSEASRKKGILAIENFAAETNDDFLRKGINLLVDGVDRDGIEASLMNSIKQTQKRHKVGISMVSMIGSTAPGLGLVGTYVGLIPMLVNLTDAESLGPMMAIELVSSFYGGFMANVIFNPMAKRLASKDQQEKERNELILDGILAIKDGKNPRIIKEDLMACLTKREMAKTPMLKKASDIPNALDGKIRKGA